MSLGANIGPGGVYANPRPFADLLYLRQPFYQDNQSGPGYFTATLLDGTNNPGGTNSPLDFGAYAYTISAASVHLSGVLVSMSEVLNIPPDAGPGQYTLVWTGDANGVMVVGGDPGNQNYELTCIASPSGSSAVVGDTYSGNAGVPPGTYNFNVAYDTRNPSAYYIGIVLYFSGGTHIDTLHVLMPNPANPSVSLYSEWQNWPTNPAALWNPAYLAAMAKGGLSSCRSVLDLQLGLNGTGSGSAAQSGVTLDYGGLASLPSTLTEVLVKTYINLSNVAGVKFWFSMPVTATQAYCEFVGALLGALLTGECYSAIGNETWNSSGFLYEWLWGVYFQTPGSWVKAQVHKPAGSYITIDAATVANGGNVVNAAGSNPGYIQTASAHPFSVGQQVMFYVDPNLQFSNDRSASSSGSTPIAGLFAQNGWYGLVQRFYVVAENFGTNTFSLAKTAGGTPVNLTSVYGGRCYIGDCTQYTFQALNASGAVVPHGLSNGDTLSFIQPPDSATQASLETAELGGLSTVVVVDANNFQIQKAYTGTGNFYDPNGLYTDYPYTMQQLPYVMQDLVYFNNITGYSGSQDPNVSYGLIAPNIWNWLAAGAGANAGKILNIVEAQSSDAGTITTRLNTIGSANFSKIWGVATAPYGSNFAIAGSAVIGANQITPQACYNPAPASWPNLNGDYFPIVMALYADGGDNTNYYTYTTLAGAVHGALWLTPSESYADGVLFYPTEAALQAAYPAAANAGYYAYVGSPASLASPVVPQPAASFGAYQSNGTAWLATASPSGTPLTIMNNLSAGVTYTLYAWMTYCFYGYAARTQVASMTFTLASASPAYFFPTVDEQINSRRFADQINMYQVMAGDAAALAALSGTENIKLITYEASSDQYNGINPGNPVPAENLFALFNSAEFQAYYASQLVTLAALGVWLYTVEDFIDYPWGSYGLDNSSTQWGAAGRAAVFASLAGQVTKYNDVPALNQEGANAFGILENPPGPYPANIMELSQLGGSETLDSGAVSYAITGNNAGGRYQISGRYLQLAQAPGSWTAANLETLMITMSTPAGVETTVPQLVLVGNPGYINLSNTSGSPAGTAGLSAFPQIAMTGQQVFPGVTAGAAGFTLISEPAITPPATSESGAWSIIFCGVQAVDTIAANAIFDLSFYYSSATSAPTNTRAALVRLYYGTAPLTGALTQAGLTEILPVSALGYIYLNQAAASLTAVSWQFQNGGSALTGGYLCLCIQDVTGLNQQQWNLGLIDFGGV